MDPYHCQQLQVQQVCGIFLSQVTRIADVRFKGSQFTHSSLSLKSLISCIRLSHTLFLLLHRSNMDQYQSHIRTTTNNDITRTRSATPLYDDKYIDDVKSAEEHSKLLQNQIAEEHELQFEKNELL